MFVQLNTRFFSSSTGIHTAALSPVSGGGNFQVPLNTLLYVCTLTLDVNPTQNAGGNPLVDFGWNTVNADQPSTFKIVLPNESESKFYLYGEPLCIIPGGNWVQIQYNNIPTTAVIAASVFGYVE